MPSLPRFVVLAAGLLLLVATAAAEASDLLAVTACDDSWQSRMNQTFAYLSAGGPGSPYVQLVAYWGNSNACVDAAEAYISRGGIGLTTAACGARTSIFTYGPGSIKRPVWFVAAPPKSNPNATKKCITLVNQSSSMAEGGSLAVALQPCCHQPQANGTNCTKLAEAAQLWWEVPSRHDPYNRIKSMLTDAWAPKGYCFTRNVTTSS